MSHAAAVLGRYLEEPQQIDDSSAGWIEFGRPLRLARSHPRRLKLVRHPVDDLVVLDSYKEIEALPYDGEIDVL